MAAIFPPAARFIFMIVEPLLLIGGAVAPYYDTADFVASQLGHLPRHRLYETEVVLALQLGNVYFLLCLMGVFILNTTSEARVVHAYIWAAWIADISHVGVTAWVMGKTAFMDVAAWNVLTYGNIAGTTLLFLARSMYLMGLLGKDRFSAVKPKQV